MAAERRIFAVLKNVRILRLLHRKYPLCHRSSSFSTINQSNLNENINSSAFGKTVRSRSDLIYFHNVDQWSSELFGKIDRGEDVKLFTNFISDDEEKQFERDTYQQLRRLRYEEEHWDDAITKYREIEKSDWSQISQLAIQRVREIAFPADSRLFSLVHVLDLAADGYIKPHIDSKRYCGDIIAGLSLLTDSVMRLVHKNEKHLIFDLHLKRCSLYILRGIARYDFTHEILQDADSYFNNIRVPRATRRLAVICRALPDSTEGMHDDDKSEI